MNFQLVGYLEVYRKEGRWNLDYRIIVLLTERCVIGINMSKCGNEFRDEEVLNVVNESVQYVQCCLTCKQKNCLCPNVH